MGAFDALLGIPPTSRVGTLSSLANMPLNMPSLVPPLRLGSSTGGLAPGNGWGDAATTGKPATPTIAQLAEQDGATIPIADDNRGPSGWQRAAGIVGDALLTAFNKPTIYGPAAQAYARMQPDPLDQAYKRAQIAKALQPAQPKVGTFQQEVNDLRANGATDDDIHSLVLNKVNPFQAVPGHDEQGRPTLTMVRPNQIGGVPLAAAPSSAPDAGIGSMPVGTVVNGHRYMGGDTTNQSNWQPVGGAPSQGGATFSPSQAFDAVIQQESGGRAGVTGPQTPYGRAQGSSQMLPATAHAMADKLGIAWMPDMMTGTTPEAADYQRQLGRAYFDEGLGKTGNVYDAARYYFAGPNRAGWGPKTTAYANGIVARLGGM